MGWSKALVALSRLAVVALLASVSIAMAATSLDDWEELENSNLSPHEKIQFSRALLEDHQKQQYLAGEVRGNIVLAFAYLSLEDAAQTQAHLALARQLNDKHNSLLDRLRINNLQVSLYALEGNLNAAVEMAISNLALSKTVDDEVLQGDILIQYAYIMQLESQYEEAIEHLYKAQIIFELLHDKSRLMMIQSNLAMIFVKLKNYPRAIEYHLHAIELAKEIGDDFSLSIFYYNLGSAFANKKDWPQTIHYFSEAREMSLMLEDKAGIALATARLGSVMMKNQQFEDALPLLLEANQMLVDSGALHMRMWIKLDIAMCHAQSGQRSLAKAFITEVELMMAEAGKDDRFPYFALGEVYAELGEYEAASKIFYQHILDLNEDFEIKKNISLQRLEVIYDVRFEKSRSELLRQENMLKESELARQNQSRLILALVLALVLVFLGLTFRQIRIQRGHKRRFKALAFKDELTKVANRRGILELAQTCYEQTKQDNSSLALALIDLDHFKQINDRFGHDVGDKVLIHFANMASHSLRSHEFVGRYGGEEWLLVLPKAELSDIKPLFHKLVKAYQKDKLSCLPSDVVLNFSMGVVMANYHADVSIDMLLKQADAALYRAKDNGRARCEIHEQNRESII